MPSRLLENINSLNLSVRSFININDLFLPIIVDIKNIVDKEEEIEYYKVVFMENKDDFKYAVDTTENIFEDQIKNYEIKKKLLFIHKFIDFEIIDSSNNNVGITMNKLFDYDITNGESFVNMIFSLPNFYNEEDIIKAVYEINFYIGRIKNKFIEKAKQIFDWDREFPIVRLESDNLIDPNLKKHATYPFAMLELQCVSEYPMAIWFSENYGKAYDEWSWREKELKKMYITMKNRLESYTERIIAYSSEQKRNSSNNRTRQSR